MNNSFVERGIMKILEKIGDKQLVYQGTFRSPKTYDTKEGAEEALDRFCEHHSSFDGYLILSTSIEEVEGGWIAVCYYARYKCNT